MELIEIEAKTFKKEIYSLYKTLFPVNERKPYYKIASFVKKGISVILKIEHQGQIIGFCIINKIRRIEYIHLEYFGIFPEHQGKGYGTEILKKLKEKYIEYRGILIEIEKLGSGRNDEENIIREKRAKFYERIGFSKLPIDIYLFNTLFSIYLLSNQDEITEDIENEAINQLKQIYIKMLGERLYKKFVKVIE